MLINVISLTKPPPPHARGNSEMETKTMTKRKKLPAIILGLILLSLFSVQSSFAQQRQSQSDEELKMLRKEIEAVKEGQTAIQKDVQEIKNLLKTRPAAAPSIAPSDIALNIEGEPFKGDKTAKVVLVEFSDYQ